MKEVLLSFAILLKLYIQVDPNICEISPTCFYADTNYMVTVQGIQVPNRIMNYDTQGGLKVKTSHPCF